jgi:long-chain acyl-CoA synthetase
VKRFTLLPRELTLEAGELPPTSKTKCRVVSERFAADIEGMDSAEPR